MVQHGVSMYFGSVTAPDPEHLRRLKQLVRRTKTPWLSDHLCWGSVDGTYTHDLLPLPYTWEAVERTVERVRMVQDFLEIPVAVENVSLRRVYRLRDDRVGVPDRSRGARRLRHSAGREQHLCLGHES